MVSRAKALEDLARVLQGVSIVLKCAAKLPSDHLARVSSNFVLNNCRSNRISVTHISSPSLRASLSPGPSTTAAQPVVSAPSEFPLAISHTSRAVIASPSAGARLATPSSSSFSLSPAPPAPKVPTVSTDALSSSKVDAAVSTVPLSSSAHPLVLPKQSFQRYPTERRVPASPMGRLLGFGELGLRLALGTVYDATKGLLTGDKPVKILPAQSAPPPPESKDANLMSSVSTGTSTAVSVSQSELPVQSSSPAVGSVFFTEANAERFAAGLCRMRGAALKVGQMLSIMDESLVPPQMQQILERVRDSADVMPQKQLLKAMRTELGEEWQSKLKDFDFSPIAAASIGQVHRATLHDGQRVVMKIQYPGVAQSIKSDVSNLKRLIQLVGILPKGLYLDESIKAAEEELTFECDYTREAESQEKFRKLLADEPGVHVPRVIPELSTKCLLTSELVEGLPIDKLVNFDQATRNRIAFLLLRVCLRELFEFRFMQTDPNWSNFLYNPQMGVLNLVDFGAARSYDKAFTDEYLRMVYACAHRDRQGVLDSSHRLGFLTGDESRSLLDTHVEAGFIVGEPFGTKGPYDFAAHRIPDRVSKLAPVMVKERLTPPPKEAYTLHRKLSGAFLTCQKLRAVINCQDDFEAFYRRFGPPPR